VPSLSIIENLNFVKLTSKKSNLFETSSGTDKEEVIKAAFQTFDIDGSGKFSEDNLRRSLILWGEKLTDSEVDNAFKEAKIDRQGKIDIEGYVKLISGSKDDEEA
jgi:myosin regulatory light chain 12